MIAAVAGLLMMTACNSNEPKNNSETMTDGKTIVENIMTRTSIRNYTDQKVSADTIETLLRAGMAAKAPLAIVVCGDMKKTLEGGGRAFWIQDCSAATENILLAAHALGLGAVWTGTYPNDERVAAVADVLKLPETIIPLCTIVIGYPSEQPQPKDKWNPENVSYNEYGGKIG